MQWEVLHHQNKLRKPKQHLFYIKHKKKISPVKTSPVFNKHKIVFHMQNI